MIATPTIDGKFEQAYLHSVFNLQKELELKEIKSNLLTISGISIIGYARNLIVQQFISSNMTHILMLDSDMGVDQKSVIDCLESGYDFCAIPYLQRDGKKAFGVAFGDEMSIGDGQFQEVNYAGTGALVLSKKVFTSLNVNSYELYGEKLMEYFHNEKAPDGTFVGEDISFCMKWKDSGKKIWLNTYGKTKHIGKHEYVYP